MYLLDVKDGKFWWKKQSASGNWIFISEEEMEESRREFINMKERIAARVMERVFSVREKEA